MSGYDQQTNKIFHPQELLRTFEQTLLQIKHVDPDRYGIMHKGTPFYLMGWLAYEMKDYEKGVFYMDAALSEDICNSRGEWESLPAASFIFLDDSIKAASAREITIEIKHEVDSQLYRFSKQSGTFIDTDILTNNFLKPYASQPSYRSIMMSLFTFLLEGKDRVAQLQLRSRNGGTLEPFITHLFKGGLIFESLLKKQDNTHNKTLGAYLSDAKDDLELKIQLYRRHSDKSEDYLYKFEDLPEYIKHWKRANFHERAVAIAYAVRSSLAHDLGWQDKLTDDLYFILYEGIVNAIFWTIKKIYKV
jgi:hypothetical protein